MAEKARDRSWLTIKALATFRHHYLAGEREKRNKWVIFIILLNRYLDICVDCISYKSLKSQKRSPKFV